MVTISGSRVHLRDLGCSLSLSQRKNTILEIIFQHLPSLWAQLFACWENFILKRANSRCAWGEAMAVGSMVLDLLPSTIFLPFAFSAAVQLCFCVVESFDFKASLNWPQRKSCYILSLRNTEKVIFIPLYITYLHLFYHAFTNHPRRIVLSFKLSKNINVGASSCTTA